MNKIARLFVCTFVFVTLTSSAAAATRTWAGTSGNWSNPANWVGGVAPVAGDDLVFPNATTYTATNDFPVSTPFQSLTFLAGPADTVTLAGNAIVLGAGGIVAQDGARIELPVTLGADQLWQVTRSLSFAQPTNINGRTLTINNATENSEVSWTGAGVVTGAGHIVVNGGRLRLDASTGTSALTLNGVIASVGTHPGPIVVNAGSTPDPRPAGALNRRGLSTCGPTGPITVNGDTLRPRENAPLDCVASIGTLTMSPAATLGYPVRVTGTVSLGGATYEYTDSGYAVTIIDNDGVDPVSGTFAGLPEGAIVRAQFTNNYYGITYRGGTGNDVVRYLVPSQATTFTVTNLNDSGPGSLRQAVLDANANVGHDTILFAPGLTGTIVLTSGELVITDNVDIIGPAAGSIAVSGNNTSRIFDITDGEMSRIANLTLTNGRSAEGGAVRALAFLMEFANVTFTNNTATTGDGGAIHVVRTGFPAELRIVNSTFTGNTALVGMGGALYADIDRLFADQLTMTINQAGGSGGAVHSITRSAGRVGPGYMFVTHSYFSNNQSCLAPTVVCGGGALSVVGFALVEDMIAGLTLVASTVAGNNANGGYGGGIYLSGPLGAPHRIDHSTIAGNSASEGGGIYSTSNRNDLLSSTIVNNTAAAGGGVLLNAGRIRNSTIAANSATGDGGGVYLINGGAIIDSIVADNTSGGATPDLAGGGTFRVEYSLIETPGPLSGAINCVPAGTCIFGQDPQLGPLQTDPGSPTTTRAPAPTSPAINTGDPTPDSFDYPTTDQRYYPRIAGGRVDMGAVEVQAAPTMADLVVGAAPTTFTATQPGSYRITVRNEGPATATNVTVTDAPLAGATLLSATASQGICTVTTTVVCNIGDLAPASALGQVATIDVFVVYAAPGSSANTATASSPTPEANAANNSVTRTFTVNAAPGPRPSYDLRLTGTGSAQGQQLVYEFVVSNAGPGPAGDVVFTDPIPAGTSFVSANSTQGTCTVANGEITCTLGTLASGRSANITITLLATGDGPITNAAVVSARGDNGGGETQFTNNAVNVVLEAHGEVHIPTLAEWMQLLLAALLGLAACLILRVR